MRSLEQINSDNQSDGRPLLDTHPDQMTLGLPARNMRIGQGEQDDISGRINVNEWAKDQLVLSEYTILIKYRSEVNYLTDVLDCTRSNAAKIIQAAIREGYIK